MAKKHFHYKEQTFQADAVKSIVDVFKGVRFHKHSVLTEQVDQLHGLAIESTQSQLNTDDFKVIKNNIRQIQRQNQLNVSEVDLSGLNKKDYPVLDICMETGTGKTFSYIQTIFELNSKYKLNHFVIVVPSIAIKAGVIKTFETTEHYFKSIYHKKATVREYKTEKSSKKNALPGAINDFTGGLDLQVMIITNHAFNKDTNVINNEAEGFIGLYDESTPIEAIATKRPVMIIDEPQKLSGKATLTAIDKFDPLFMIRYSATFKEVKNMLYVLDAFDAYERKLVKKIEVANFYLPKHARADLYLKAINTKGERAQVVVVAKSKEGKLKEIRTPIENASNILFEKTKNEDYKGLTITTIDRQKKLIKLSNGESLKLGESWSTATGSQIDVLKRLMIEETISKHFQKEYDLFQKGIKCISLFFVETVKDYRDFDKEDDKGLLQDVFEQTYQQYVDQYLLRDDISQAYKDYLQKWQAHEVHGGYFAADKKKSAQLEKGGANQTVRDIENEIYNAIMRDKEKLLDASFRLRFIFAHSALREGWDNPNVFQLCLLRQSDNNMKRVQEVGRGLRLCVNKNLERMDSEVLDDLEFVDINKLSVFAMEDNFIKGLQDEFNDRRSQFKQQTKQTVEEIFKQITNYEDKPRYTRRELDAIIDELADNGALDKDAKYILSESLLAETLRSDQNHKFFEAEEIKLDKLISELTQQQSIKVDDARNEFTKVRRYHVNPVKYKAYFKELWELLHQDVIYEIDLSKINYVEQVVKKINETLQITKSTIQREEYNAEKTLETANVQHNLHSKPIDSPISMADFLDQLQEKTKLAKNVLIEIIQKIDAAKFNLIKNNPYEAIEKISEIITSVIFSRISDCVTVKKTDAVKKRQAKVNNFVDMSFQAKKYVDMEAIAGSDHNGLFNQIMPYDSDDPERDIIVSTGKNDLLGELKEYGYDCIKVFAKLPCAVHIPTPINKQGIDPDFGFVLIKNDGSQFYLIAEAKPTTSDHKLRESEQFKVAFLKKYFESLGCSNIRYQTVASYSDVIGALE